MVLQSFKSDKQLGPTVSIVLPVYQVVDYIDECIESILVQDFQDFELIVVDDGSSDGSGKKCDDWARVDARIAVYHQVNSGQSVARNFGIGKASGTYLLFVDSDDYIFPSLISSSVNRIRECNSDICFFKYVELHGDGSINSYKQSRLFPEIQCCDHVQALKLLLTQRIDNYPFMRLAKRSLYVSDDKFFPEGRKMEDLASTPRLVSRAKQVCFLDRELYVYRKREGSSIYRWSPELTMDTIAAFRDIEYDLRDQPLDIQLAALNYKIKFLFTCLMLGSSTSIRRQGNKAYDSARDEMVLSCKKCGWDNLTLANKVKLGLTKLNLVGLAAKLRN